MGIRSFISINIDDVIKRDINDLLTDLKRHNLDVKWIPPENLHITLKFLGNVPENTLERVKELLQGISSFKTFRLRFKGTGFFPGRKRPRVIWIGITDSNILRSLQEIIEERMSALGFAKEERPFSPHLTIGRIRSLRDQERLNEVIEAIKDREFGIIDVDRIFLMKSDLRPGGAVYSVIAEFPLGGCKESVKV